MFKFTVDGLQLTVEDQEQLIIDNLELIIKNQLTANREQITVEGQKHFTIKQIINRFMKFVGATIRGCLWDKIKLWLIEQSRPRLVVCNG